MRSAEQKRKVSLQFIPLSVEGVGVAVCVWGDYIVCVCVLKHRCWFALLNINLP